MDDFDKQIRQNKFYQGKKSHILLEIKDSLNRKLSILYCRIFGN